MYLAQEIRDFVQMDGICHNVLYGQMLFVFVQIYGTIFVQPDGSYFCTDRLLSFYMDKL